MAILPIALGVAGALAGTQRQSSSQGLSVAPASSLERQAAGLNSNMLSQLQSGVGQGPGMAEIGAGLQSSNALAAMLESYSKGNFLPSAQDFQTAMQFTNQAFQPQQVAMQQAFKGQEQRAAQMASRLGREVNDPIIQSRLAQEQMQSQERLGAAQSAYSSQFALNLPQQRLGYMAQMADVRNNLASQALSNRQALLGMGQQQQNMERNWRLNTASRTSSSGGGLAGAISGGLAGMGAGFGAMNAFGAMMGGGEQQWQMPQQAQQFNAGMQSLGAAQQAFAPPMQQASQGVPTMLQPNANPYPQFSQQPSYNPYNSTPWNFNYLGQIGQ